MFVRRKTRRSQGNRLYHAWQSIDDLTLSASLVECSRVGGRPRQRVVSYLARIHQSDLQRGDFTIGN